MVTPFEDGKPISSSHKEIHSFSLGEIQSFFFKKLRDELSLSEVGGRSALYDVIGIPMDAFSIYDERAENLTGAISYVLFEYAKLPMTELNGKSLNDVGISIELCKRIPDGDVNSSILEYMQRNNFQYLTEEVLWKNMTDEEKSEKFAEYLEAIKSENSELIIVDPYLFHNAQSDDNYRAMLVSILKKSKAKNIIVVTDKAHCQIKDANAFSDEIGIPLSVQYSINL